MYVVWFMLLVAVVFMAITYLASEKFARWFGKWKKMVATIERAKNALMVIMLVLIPILFATIVIGIAFFHDEGREVIVDEKEIISHQKMMSMGDYHVILTADGRAQFVVALDSGEVKLNAPALENNVAIFYGEDVAHVVRHEITKTHCNKILFLTSRRKSTTRYEYEFFVPSRDSVLYLYEEISAPQPGG